MLKKQRLLVVLIALALAACAGDKTPIGNDGLQKGLRALPKLSRCILIKLVMLKDGVQTPDPEFERVNRKMVWRFSLANNVLRSERKGPGQPIVAQVPVVKNSREMIVAEGHVPDTLGPKRVRIEIERKADAVGKIRVRQSRTWMISDGPAYKLNRKTITFKDTWTLQCQAEKNNSKRS